MHLAHLVNGTGVEEDALGQRGLARVDVRGHAEVAGALQAGEHWRTTAVLHLAGADVLEGRMEVGGVCVHGCQLWSWVGVKSGPSEGVG